MRTSLLASFLLLAAACGDNGDTNTVDARPRPDGRPPSVDADPNAPDADPSAPDAPAGTPDAPAGNPDAPPTSGPSPLIISEVRNNGAEEFVEIYNPNAAAVDLRNYYLSDAPSFWMLPGHPTTPIVLDASDFLERFPAGASIPAGILGYQRGVLRWQARLVAYHASLVDDYPPLALDTNDSDHATLTTSEAR